VLLLLRYITSNPYADPRAITLLDADFDNGGLQRLSHARASKLFTADQSLFQRGVRRLDAARHGQVVEAVVAMVRTGG
jgi:mRNA interferase MazF